MKILLVDPDVEDSALIEYSLKQSGYNIRRAISRQSAINSLKTFKPEIVILDFVFGNVQDTSLMQDMIEKADEPKPFIMVLTSVNDPGVMLESLANGAHDFMVKPYNFAEFAIRLENMITLRKTLTTNLELNEKIKLQRDKLGRFFSNELVARILDGSINTDIGGTVREASILICDLRNSVGLSEKLSAKKFALFLSDLFAGLGDLISSEGGSITNFRGDGLLATFGVPSKIKQPALAAVSTAFKIRRHLEFFNQYRPAFIPLPVHMGVGVATGKVFVGNIGSTHRLDYTVLGDAVNLAARLEALTKELKTDILIDNETNRQIKGEAETEKLQIDSIRGRSKRIRIFGLKTVYRVE
ncbi:MAG: response regulator [Leptospiraceae bacterium]|nr:response regulator [Leptospiraceae bacterium]